MISSINIVSRCDIYLHDRPIMGTQQGLPRPYFTEMAWEC